MNLLDTIAAVSTPYGKGGVSLIRISGDRALEIANAVFTLRNGKKLSECAARRLVYGDIVSPVTGEHIDDVMAVFMPAPNTYTGEDTVEITAHGGILITEAVLSAVLSAGARAAEAGEYTRRAFINGRISLTEAESLGLMLEAKDDAQLRLYRSGKNGRLYAKISEIYQNICILQSNIFACIDYPDEDLADLSREEMVSKVRDIFSELSALSGTYKTGIAVGEGYPATICGLTNAGKSSLYNLMAGYEAAIVTDIEGTTRDVLSENVTLGRVHLRLSDTAGLRDSSDAVEKIGIERAIKAIDSAGIVFAVFDGSKPLEDAERGLIEKIKSLPDSVIRFGIINKADKATAIADDSDDAAVLKSVFSRVLRISAKTGEGFPELVNAVEDLLIDDKISIENDPVIINARQFAAINGATAALERAYENLNGGLEIDMCCSDIEEAMRFLGELDGKNVAEDVVTAIFKHFCVGK